MLGDTLKMIFYKCSILMYATLIRIQLFLGMKEYVIFYIFKL
jgi:hypothetical protein